MVTQGEIDHLETLLKSKLITAETKYILLDKMYDRLFVENITYVTLITPEYIKKSIDALDYLDDKSGLKAKIDDLNKRIVPLEKEIEEAINTKDQAKIDDLIKVVDKIQSERSLLIKALEDETQKGQTTVIELQGIVQGMEGRFKKVQGQNKLRLKRHKWIKRGLRLLLLIISLLIAIGVDRLSAGFKECFSIKKDFHLVTIIVFFVLDIGIVGKVETRLTGKLDQGYFNARLTELNDLFNPFEQEFKNTCAATGMTEQQIFDLVDRLIRRATG